MTLLRRLQDLPARVSSGISRWFQRGGGIPLESWARFNQLNKPIENEQILFVRQGDQKTVSSFASLCHERVQDREVSFTCDKRIQLYDRWLSSQQPCLMAVTDGDNLLIAASIVLPLTDEGYHGYCSGRLDALDIESRHIVQVGSRDPLPISAHRHPGNE